MNAQRNSTSNTLRRLVVIAIVAVVVGVALVVVSIGLEWRGFVGGMAQGAGIGIAAVGCYFWGYANGLRKTVARAAWLPSRDAAR